MRRLTSVPGVKSGSILEPGIYPGFFTQDRGAEEHTGTIRDLGDEERVPKAARKRGWYIIYWEF